MYNYCLNSYGFFSKSDFPNFENSELTESTSNDPLVMLFEIFSSISEFAEVQGLHSVLTTLLDLLCLYFEKINSQLNIHGNEKINLNSDKISGLISQISYYFNNIKSGIQVKVSPENKKQIIPWLFDLSEFELESFEYYSITYYKYIIISRLILQLNIISKDNTKKIKKNPVIELDKIFEEGKQNKVYRILLNDIKFLDGLELINKRIHTFENSINQVSEFLNNILNGFDLDNLNNIRCDLMKKSTTLMRYLVKEQSMRDH